MRCRAAWGRKPWSCQSGGTGKLWGGRRWESPLTNISGHSETKQGQEVGKNGSKNLERDVAIDPLVWWRVKSQLFPGPHRMHIFALSVLLFNRRAEFRMKVDTNASVPFREERSETVPHGKERTGDSLVLSGPPFPALRCMV